VTRYEIQIMHPDGTLKIEYDNSVNPAVTMARGLISAGIATEATVVQISEMRTNLVTFRRTGTSWEEVNA
jgi:hypothetical protein